VLALGANGLPLGFTDGAVVDQGIEALCCPLLMVVTVHSISRGIRKNNHSSQY
jgi:hypothetical protein